MLAWIHADVYTGSHFGWMSICFILKCLFYCDFCLFLGQTRVYNSTTWFINWMTWLVLFNNSSTVWRYQFIESPKNPKMCNLAPLLLRVGKLDSTWLCDIPWYTGFRGNTLSLTSALYFWASVGCDVVSCHVILAWYVYGLSRRTPT